MAGESLGRLIAGSPEVAGEFAFLEGLDTGSKIRARQANTESALALAKQRRDENLAKQKLSEEFPELGQFFQAGIDPRQLRGAQLQEHELGVREQLSDLETDLPFGDRQRLGQSVAADPRFKASDLLGPGGELFLDVFAEQPTAESFQPTATGEAQIAADTELANLRKERREHPERFKASNVFNIGAEGKGLGDIILEDIGESTIPSDIDPQSATGLSGAFYQASNVLFDVVNANLPFPETDEAANALTDLHTRTMTTFQQSIPGRPSNYLLEVGARFGVTPNNPFKADQRTFNRLSQTSSFLNGEQDRLRRTLNAGRLTPTRIADAESALRSIAELKRDIDVVISRFQAAGIGAQQTEAGGTFVVEDE
jgi:hypothetical protein